MTRLKWLGFLAGFLLPAAAAVSAPPQPAMFREPRRFPAGDNPVSAVIADFNHDGRPDVATAALNDVAILLNNGNGFAAPVVYGTSAAASLAVADFNQDGNLDIAMVNGGVNVYLLFGNGDGTFQPPVAVALPLGAQSVVAGDFNGDGKPDLAIGSASILVLLGDGHGGFGSPISTSTTQAVASLAVGEFNNDAKLDLAVVIELPIAHQHELLSFLGNGDGTFQQKQLVASGQGFNNLLVYDIDGDGNQDILVPGKIYPGSGTGAFQPPVSYPSAGTPHWIAVADVNGDGHPDILGSVPIGNLSITLGQGGLSFQRGANYCAGFGPGWIGAADFLGHGRADIVLLTGSYIGLLPDSQGGRYPAHPVINLEQSALANPVLADFNSDGNLDAAVLTYSPSVSILLGDGKGGFSPGTPAMAGPLPAAVISGDFNADGKPDLAVADAQTNAVYILLGTGNDTFTPAGSYPVPISCGSARTLCYFLGVTDLNGDGKQDLVVLGGDPNSSDAAVAAALLGNGDGTFRPALTIASGLEPREFALGDFNHDGYADLVFSTAGSVELFLGNGDGTFRNPITIYAQGPANAVAADFNRDGNLDLAFTNAQSQLVIKLGNGDATFTESQIINQFPGPPLVADFNGDGYPDLFANTGQNPSFGLYLGNGNGTFTLQADAPLFCVSQVWCGTAAGDVNGDGRIDLFSLQIGLQFSETPLSVLLNTTH